MNDGFEDARERRNTLEELVDRIPGFRGYQDRELRREVDRMQREHMAREVEALKVALRKRSSAYTDAGRIQDLTLFDRLDRRLDGLSQRLRFADYGHSGLFDAVKIYEEELEKLYQFDLSLLQDLGELRESLNQVPAPNAAAPGTASTDEGPRPALEQAAAHLDSIEEKWSRRDQVMSDVVKGTASATPPLPPIPTTEHEES